MRPCPYLHCLPASLDHSCIEYPPWEGLGSIAAHSGSTNYELFICRAFLHNLVEPSLLILLRQAPLCRIYLAPLIFPQFLILSLRGYLNMVPAPIPNDPYVIHGIRTGSYIDPVTHKRKWPPRRDIDEMMTAQDQKHAILFLVALKDMQDRSLNGTLSFFQIAGSWRCTCWRI